MLSTAKTKTCNATQENQVRTMQKHETDGTTEQIVPVQILSRSTTAQKTPYGETISAE